MGQEHPPEGEAELTEHLILALKMEVEEVVEEAEAQMVMLRIIHWSPGRLEELPAEEEEAAAAQGSSLARGWPTLTATYHPWHSTVEEVPWCQTGYWQVALRCHHQFDRHRHRTNHSQTPQQTNRHPPDAHATCAPGALELGAH